MVKEEAYRKAYVAMTTGSDEMYSAAMVAAHEAFSSDENSADEQPAMFVLPNEEPSQGTSDYVQGSDIHPLEASLALSATPENEVEVMYAPEPSMKKPPGKASLGMDAFKLACCIDSLSQPEKEVIADSGAAATLISKDFLLSLGDAAPKIKQGLKLLHLTGEARCLGYILLDLFFWSQKGVILLRGIEATLVSHLSLPN